jgi:hypothetical protein
MFCSKRYPDPYDYLLAEIPLEAISKLGFWSKVKAAPSFNPQAY